MDIVKSAKIIIAHDGLTPDIKQKLMFLLLSGDITQDEYCEVCNFASTRENK